MVKSCTALEWMATLHRPLERRIYEEAAILSLLLLVQLLHTSAFSEDKTRPIHRQYWIVHSKGKLMTASDLIILNITQ